MDPVLLSDEETIEVITKMGADDVMVNHLVADNGTKMVFVAFFRKGGCGRIYTNVCTYLGKRYKDEKIVVLESPRLDKPCFKARERKPGNNKHFSKIPVPVHVTEEMLGV
ncbi:MAG: hypothetical protein NTV39_04275 [Candidatus Saccharibacteria bacterium]|nr:hypothetical protein [Candidatus Saccharibacteria bacterium]